MTEKWIPPRTQRWDFQNKCPVEDLKKTTSDNGQFRLGDVLEPNVGWRENTEKQVYCGRYSHTEENGRCVLCEAVREE